MHYGVNLLLCYHCWSVLAGMILYTKLKFLYELMLYLVPASQIITATL